MRDESGAVVPLAVRGGTAMHAFNPSNGEHMGPASNFTAEQRAVLVLVPENYAHPIEGQLRRVRWSGDGRPVLWLSPEQLADEAEAEQ